MTELFTAFSPLPMGRGNSDPLAPVLAAAPYLRDLAARHAEWFGQALRRSAEDAFQDVIADMRETPADESDLARRLRVGKARGALLLAVAEIGQVWPVAETTRRMSDLADVALKAALDFLMAEAAREGRLLHPDQANGSQSGLAIFALGKHGGQELNFSSDIDIVAFYDTHRPVLAESVDPGQFYVRLVRRLVAIMQERTG